MKNALLLLVTMVLSATCRKDETIGPPELLYKRWRKVVTQYDNGQAINQRQNDTTSVEFRRDGRILYGGVYYETSCCGATRFTLENRTLMLAGNIPCATVFCKAPSQWTIVRLTDVELWLRDEAAVTKYESVD